MEDNNRMEEQRKLHILSPDDLDDEDETGEVIDIRPVENPTSLKATVAEMLIGMLLWGILCEVVILIVVPDILRCSVGLWIGIILSAGSAVHMAWSFDKAVDLEQKSAQAKIRMHALIRYAVIVIVFAVILFTGVINPLAAFAGILALKVSAYLQPLVHRVLKSNPRR